MKKLIFFFLCFILFTKLQAQDTLNFEKADKELSSVINNLPKDKFYFVGQAHDNKANTLIESGLLLALDKKYNVHYDVIEYAESVAFLLDLYLDTGQDSLLCFIDPKASFNFIKSIRKFNETAPDSSKIKFWGIDFEGRHKGKYTREAIKIILDDVHLSVKNPLRITLNAIVHSAPDSMKDNLDRLKMYLLKNKQRSRFLLGKYFIDVLLMANAQYNFSPRRDKFMFSNFKLLYSALRSQRENPRFFASFGIGHINPENNKGFAMIILNSKDSPVRGKVSIIGVEYYNCTFFTGKEIMDKQTYGTLNFICRKPIITNLYKPTDDKDESISFISKKELANLDYNKYVKTLDGILVIENFGPTFFWKWE
jgi:hypothetical protein